MKSLVQFITEAANTTAIVNKIKKEFQKEFGDKVTIGSVRANYQQLYDVYIYDMDISTLKKVNDILKKHLTIWKGFTDEEIQKKLDDKKEFFDKHKDDKSVNIDRYPVEFFRFTSHDLRKMLNENINEGLARHEEKHDEQWLERVFRSAKVDRDKDIYVLLRNIKKKQLKVVKYDDDVKDIMMNGNEDGWFFQLMSNDEADMKRWAHLPTFRKDKYKLVTESCDAPEHKIVKDAAGNWRIKGTPGKGTNTDKEGLWAAKYDTEKDAKKALAAYHVHKNESIQEGKNTFTLDDNEREALAEFLGIITGNLGEESEIKKYTNLFKSLEDGEFDKLSDIYDFLDNSETYPKITYRNFQQDERQLVKKCYDWAVEHDLVGENWDLMDAAEKIS